MKMPNFASLYHCGCSYLISEAQSGRKGPSSACFSASASSRLRSASYLLTDCCHSWSISAADLTPRVGARGSVGGGVWARSTAVDTRAEKAKNAISFCITRHRKLRREALQTLSFGVVQITKYLSLTYSYIGIY